MIWDLLSSNTSFVLSYIECKGLYSDIVIPQPHCVRLYLNPLWQKSIFFGDLNLSTHKSGAGQAALGLSLILVGPWNAPTDFTCVERLSFRRICLARWLVKGLGKAWNVETSGQSYLRGWENPVGVTGHLSKRSGSGGARTWIHDTLQQAGIRSKFHLAPLESN